MATINQPPKQAQATSNVAPQQQMTPSTSGAPTGSGQFSTLQKYLGANQNAGQRIAGMVGGNVQREATRIGDTTQREIGEAANANTQFGKLTDETSGFTQKLSAPAGPAPVNPTTQVYDVNSYSANLSGQQAAQDIASNKDTLNRFTGIRTGDVAAEQKAQSEKEARDAVKAATDAYDTNKQRQTQLTNSGQRSQLLSNILNTQNQRAGVRNLDNAFVSQDKTKALNNVTNQLRQDVSGIKEKQLAGETEEGRITGLSEAQQLAEKSLVDRLTGMQKEYDTTLDARIGSVNVGKAKRTADYLDQWRKLQANEQVSEGFAKDLGLDKAFAADPTRVGSASGEMSNNMGMAGPLQGIRLFNEIKDQDLRANLDLSTLEREALTRGDVVNQRDIDALNNLAALSGEQNYLNKVSDFSGRQVKALDLADRLNTRADKFQTEDLSKGFQGSGRGEEGVYRDTWSGKRQTGTATANASAAASLDDYLSGNIYRNTGAEETQSKGFLDRVLRDPREILGSILDLPGAILQPKGFESEGAVGLESKDKLDAITQNLATRRAALTNAGYTTSGGLTGRDHGWGRGEQERVATTAEAGAVNQVNQQAQDYLKNIGYANLVKIAKGDF